MLPKNRAFHAFFKSHSSNLLWAAGRTGNSDDLGLESVGLKPDGRGYLGVDACGETTVPGVFAVCDLVGFPSLAGAAFTQGRTVVRRILWIRHLTTRRWPKRTG